MLGIHSVIDSKIIKVSPETNIHTISEIMKKNETGYVLILDTFGIRGVFSERDIVTKVVAEGKDVNTTQVKEVMTIDVFSVPVNFKLDEALEMMTTHQLRHLLVHDESQNVFGIVHLFDVLRYTQDQESDGHVRIENTLKKLNFELNLNNRVFQDTHRVLLVENSKLFSKLLSKDLKLLKIEDIVTVANGTEALERVLVAEDSPFDVIICEWNIPGISAMEFLTELRKVDFEKAPFFLMVCEQGDVSPILDAITFGADNYIVKPFNLEKLKQRLGGRYLRKVS